MKPKDIFGLAVRLLGLFFLYLGLRAVTRLLDLDVIENPDKNEIINDLLPVVFNLIVAGWLLTGRMLIRRAYPETSATHELMSAPVKRTAPQPEPAPGAAPAAMASAEEKLASLVEKPKPTKAA